MTIYYDPNGKYFTDIVSKEGLPVVIQTTNQRIEGTIYIRSGERLKDELNQPEQFLAVTEVVVFDSVGQEILRSSFLAINRDKVIWVLPKVEMETAVTQPGEIE